MKFVAPEGLLSLREEIEETASHHQRQSNSEEWLRYEGKSPLRGAVPRLINRYSSPSK
jgi:hypothetical protein